MSRVSLLVAIGLGLATSCSGPTKTSGVNGGDDTVPETDCEPGRCLTDIANAVKEHREKARACFDDGVAKRDIKGNRVLINFRIEADGTVSEASQSVKGDQIEDPEVVACMTDVIKQITFAKSAAGKRTRAYHSFEFARRGSAP